MQIMLTAEEWEALKALAEKVDLPEERVMIQALRLYQAYIYGSIEVKHKGPVGCPSLE